ncbi:MAG: hypothetical protein FWG93_02255 [Oscillospiraceae bacterium]|nr:hypothetical protein [Oscillospiraceae bacterium]
MKYDCELIQDLIPLVKDGIASDASQTAVGLHIEQCDICKGIYEADAQIVFPAFDENTSAEISQVVDYKSRIKRRRKTGVVLLVLIYAVSLVFATAGGMLIPQMRTLYNTMSTRAAIAFFGEKYSTRDIAEYGHYSGHTNAKDAARNNRDIEESAFFTALAIFPETIPASADVKDYYYFFSSGVWNHAYQLYLVCSYDDYDYSQEKERLESLELTFNGETHRPVITDTGFSYRAVVTLFGHQHSYEYALLDEETNTVAYVYAQSMGIDPSVVAAEHRPKGWRPPEDRLTEWGAFNIYLFKTGSDEFPLYVIWGKDYTNE